MRISVIGTGNIGGTLAKLLVATGHEVLLANSRGPESLTDMVAELGPRATATTVEKAALDGELAVIAIPLGHYRDLPASAFAEKIVVDAGNYYPERDGEIAELADGGTTSSELVAAHLARSRVVKAFNTIYFERLRDEGRTDVPAAERLAIPIAGDDEEAKRVVAALITELGFAPTDTGTLAEGRRQQPNTPVYNVPVGPDEALRLLAQA